MAVSPQKIDEPDQAQAVIHAQRWSAPLPPPDDLEHYDRVISGGAERIFRMAEEEQAHRMRQECEVLIAGVTESRRGQWFGATVALCAIAAAVGVIMMHGPWQAAVALVGVPLLGVVQAFVRGRDP